MTEVSHAVFLSYASQDAQAAHRICEALRAAGIEVWFDQSELRGGDAWDTSIRKQIKTCALFLPIISHTTHDRREGYFRLEWKLAVDRSHLMDAEMAFLLPVVIDDTRDDDERVPERFREVQWTRLPGGVTPAFVERVRGLLSGESAQPAGLRRHRLTCRLLLDPKPVLALWRSGGAPPRRLPCSSSHSVTLWQTDRAIEAWRRESLQPPPSATVALPRGTAVRELKRRQGAGVLLDGLTSGGCSARWPRSTSCRSRRASHSPSKNTRTLRPSPTAEWARPRGVRRSANTIRITVQLINAVTGSPVVEDL